MRLLLAALLALVVAAPASAASVLAPPCLAVLPPASFAATGNCLTRRSATLRGTAGIACTDVGRVEVALARGSGGQCAFLTTKDRLVHRGSCEQPVWLRAKGTSAWRATLRGRFPRGSYFAFVRAKDSQGRAGTPQRARLVAGPRRPVARRA